MFLVTFILYSLFANVILLLGILASPFWWSYAKYMSNSLTHVGDGKIEYRKLKEMIACKTNITDLVFQASLLLNVVIGNNLKYYLSKDICSKPYVWLFTFWLTVPYSFYLGKEYMFKIYEIHEASRIPTWWEILIPKKGL